MSLLPVHTPAETLLLRGPQPLVQYAGESFAWLHALRRGPVDWNTMLTLGIDPAHLVRIGRFFLDQLPPAVADAPDRHHDVRAAATCMLDVAALLTAAATLRTTAAAADTFARLAADLDRADIPAEQRARQEWAAWVHALGSFVEQEQRVEQRVRSRLKRAAADAELEQPVRPAPAEVVD